MVRMVAMGVPAPRPTAGKSLAQLATAPPDEEKGEKEVEAVPRLMRDVLGYMEPRPGIDGGAYFGNCAACSNYVPEAMMRGALRGDRCGLLGSTFMITDDAACNSFMPWPDGKPCGECQSHTANKLVAGLRASASPFDLGYVSDEKVKCSGCRHFDGADSECELIESMNESMPKVFAMDCKVKPDGTCTAWTDYPPMLDTDDA